VRFDLNDYSIPPEAVGRQLTLLASATSVRILDNSVEIARPVRSYDRHQPVLDPAHREAVLKRKRKAFHSTPAGRQEQAVPESKTLLDQAFAPGESAWASDRAPDEVAGPRSTAPSPKRSNTTRPALLPSPSCFAASLAPHCWPSISAAIRKPHRSTSALIIWRPLFPNAASYAFSCSLARPDRGHSNGSIAPLRIELDAVRRIRHHQPRLAIS
jgi:hypothetical protein